MSLQNANARFPLRLKIATVTGSLLGVLALLLAVWVPNRLEQAATTWSERRAMGIAMVLAPALQAAVDFEDKQEATRFLELLGGAPGAVYATLTMGSGGTLAAWQATTATPAVLNSPVSQRLEPAAGDTAAASDGAYVHTVTHLAKGNAHLRLGFSLAEVIADREANQTLVSLIGVAIAVLGMLAAWALGMLIARPITELTKVTARIVETGDLTHFAAIRSLDETHTLWVNFDALIAQQRGLLERLKQAGTAVAGAITELDSTGGAVMRVTGAVGSRVEEARGGANEMRGAIEGVSRSIENVQTSSERASSSILQMASTNDQIAQRSDSMARAVDETSLGVQRMKDSAASIAESVRSLDQAISETSSSLTEMHASIREVEASAKQTAQLADAAARDAATGVQAIDKTLTGIQHIRESSDVALGVIERLGQRVQSIDQIVRVISEVTEQTNLLALNAAIIAAQAGEHGRGFSVVADEIKSLAERTRTSTSEINSLIEGIVRESADAVASVRKSVESAEQGTRLGQEAGKALQTIAQSSRTATTMVQSIARATVQQSQGTSQVLAAVEQFAANAQGISRSSEAHAESAAKVLAATVHLTNLTREVHRSTQEQAQGSRQIIEAISLISQMVEALQSAQEKQGGAAGHIVGSVDAILQMSAEQIQAVDRLENVITSLRGQAQILEAELRRFRVS